LTLLLFMILSTTVTTAADSFEVISVTIYFSNDIINWLMLMPVPKCLFICIQAMSSLPKA